MGKGVAYENPPGSGKLLGLYSHVSRVEPGRMVYIAGQLAPGDFETQFRDVFGALGTILKALGTDFGSVVKFTTYLIDPDDIDPFMEERRKLFPKLFPGGMYPPNTLLIVQRLVKPEFRIEVEAVARLPE
ncbi:MAG: RidA family protein [Hyphomicrobiales bacterium]